MNFKNKEKTGFTIIEVLFSIVVLSLIMVTILMFQKNIFLLNSRSQGNLAVQQEGRKAVKSMTKEFRSISQSSIGSYPISVASDNAFTFYTDADGDGLKERIKYFMNGTTLMRAELKPTGDPAAYVEGNEVVSEFVHDVANGGSPVFSYYDSSYDGSGAPLAAPVNILSIRLIKTDLILDANGAGEPGPVTFTFQVVMRNLKDNL